MQINDPKQMKVFVFTGEDNSTWDILNVYLKGAYENS